MADEAVVRVVLQDDSGGGRSSSAQSSAASAQDTTGLRSMGQNMASAMIENLYGGLYDALVAGKEKFAGVRDPVLAKAKPYFEAGQINSPQDLQNLVRAGFPPLQPPEPPKPPAPPLPPRYTPEQIEQQTAKALKSGEALPWAPPDQPIPKLTVAGLRDDQAEFLRIEAEAARAGMSVNEYRKRELAGTLPPLAAPPPPPPPTQPPEPPASPEPPEPPEPDPHEERRKLNEERARKRAEAIAAAQAAVVAPPDPPAPPAPPAPPPAGIPAWLDEETKRQGINPGDMPDEYVDSTGQIRSYKEEAEKRLKAQADAAASAAQPASVDTVPDDIMSQAHALAKEIRDEYETYKEALSVALLVVWKKIKEAQAAEVPVTVTPEPAFDTTAPAGVPVTVTPTDAAAGPIDLDKETQEERLKRLKANEEARRQEDEARRAKAAADAAAQPSEPAFDSSIPAFDTTPPPEPPDTGTTPEPEFIPYADLAPPEKKEGEKASWLDSILELLGQFRGTIGGAGGLGKSVGSALDVISALKGGGGAGGLGAAGGMAGAAAGPLAVVAAVLQAKEALQGIAKTAIEGVAGVASFAADPSSDASVSVGKLGQAASSASESLTYVSPALSLFTGILGDATSALSSLMNSIDRTAERYGEFSPEIASAQAVAEIRQTMGDFRRAQEVSKELAAYLVAQSDLQQKFEDLKVKILVKILPAVTRILEILEAVVPTGEGIEGAIVDVVAPLLTIGTAAAKIAGLMEDEKLPEILDPTEVLMNRRKDGTVGDTPMGQAEGTVERLA